MRKLALAFKRDPELLAEFKAFLAEITAKADKRMRYMHDTTWMVRWQGYCQALDFLGTEVDKLVGKTEDNPLNPEKEDAGTGKKARRSRKA
jgi:hypothetical protein